MSISLWLWGLETFLGGKKSATTNYPEGPKIKKFEISSEIENFEREWNFRASHPPRPYFLWGNRDVEIEIFERNENFDRDWKFRARFNFFDRWALWVDRFVPRTVSGCPRNGAPFVPGAGLICPEHRPTQNVYVCWISSCPKFPPFLVREKAFPH